MDKLLTAFEQFDAWNQQDPHHLVYDGKTFPSEYFYALRLHHWVLKLDPQASEPLLLASRSQHIGRWQILRTAYPEGKNGYLKWRTELGKFHAEKAAEILQNVGYDTDTIEKVKQIILKRQIKTNTEVQCMENALCLVFLEHQYEDFISKHEDEKVIDILQKTWAKMSDPGRESAFTLNYSEKGKSLIVKALNPG